MGPFIDQQGGALPPIEATTADVVIVGAGLAGALTALYLAREGAQVVVLEARGRVGAGRSGRDLGHVETGVVEHPCRTVRSLGAERARSLFQVTAHSRSLLEQEGLFEPTGALWAAQDAREPDDIDASVAALSELGVPAERLEPAEVAERTGARGLGPALWLPGDGAVQPGRAAAEVARRATQAGARFYAGQARFADASATDGVALAVNGAVVSAEIAVIAAGAGAQQLDRRLADALSTVREQGLRVAGDGPVPSVRLGRAGHGYTSWRWLDDGSLAVTGARWATPHLEVGETDDTVIEPRIQAKLQAFAEQRFARTTVLQRWAWTFAHSKDGLPIVGPMPGDARRLVIAGLGANGASFAPAAARAVADGIMGGESALPGFLAASRMVGWR